jgi:hypothetical protein
LTFLFTEPCDLARDAERRQAIDAGGDEKADEATQARFVEVAVRVEWCGQNGIDAFEGHGLTDHTFGC